VKVIRQTKLSYQKGNSDKVYEIDLCKAGEGEFIVNFRYGRRGATLREGTKTPFPESRAKAEAIFSKLAAEKTGKGYLVDGDLGTPAPVPEIVPTPENNDPRIKATLTRIKRGPGETGWKLSRAVFRAGQWQLADALPHLLPLVDDATGMDAWCLAFALGRCGDASSIPVLETLIDNNPDDQAFVRIAREAKLNLLPENQKESFFEELSSTLPAAFSNTSSVEELAALIEKNVQIPNLASDLYLLALRRPELREALYSVAKSISPAGPGMLLLRQLFKAAEFRLDAEIYGILARRFDTTGGNGSSSYNYWEKKYTRRTFSNQTKKYLQKRIIRTLTTAGEDGDAATFIPLATGVLLAYDDELDNPVPTSRWDYGMDPRTRRWASIEVHHPPRNNAHSFLWILRGKSSDLNHSRSLRWSFLTEPKPATTREENFPHLWNAAPDAVTHLLGHARAAEVQDFAIRVWNDNTEWAKQVEIPAIIEILSSWYDPTAELGFALARDRWDPSNPNNELLLGMLASSSEAAQTLGGHWLTSVAGHVTSQPDLIARLAFITPEASRHAIRSFFTGQSLSRSIQQDTTARLISALLTLSEDDPNRARFAIETLRQVCPDELSKLPQEHLAELAAHPLEQLQLLSASILLKQNRASSLPEALLLAPLASDFASVRKLGLELLGTLSSSDLGRRAETLAACAISPIKIFANTSARSSKKSRRTTRPSVATSSNNGIPSFSESKPTKEFTTTFSSSSPAPSHARWMSFHAALTRACWNQNTLTRRLSDLPFSRTRTNSIALISPPSSSGPFIPMPNCGLTFGITSKAAPWSSPKTSVIASRFWRASGPKAANAPSPSSAKPFASRSGNLTASSPSAIPLKPKPRPSGVK
jgi:predicted DNA-binding WGR domain protein